MKLTRSSFAIAIACALGWTAMADEFVLKDGRTLRGLVKSEREVAAIKDKQLVVELSPGVLVVIHGREIKQHSRNSAPELEYAQLMKNGEDTIDFHLKMAGWCQEKGLDHHKVAHFERVLDLDPENSTAWTGLEYTKGKDGRWIKREVLMTDGRGKVRDGNKFRFPEIVALEEAEKKANLEHVSLLRDVRRWQQDVLDGNKRAADSLAKLRALDGPQASSVLSELLFPKTNAPIRREPPLEGIRQLYVAVLTRLADPVAVQTLIRMSLSDSEQPIRDAAVDALRTIAPRAAALAYIQALRSDDPKQINAAGRALAAMNDESAILPLIERIVSVHRHVTPGNNRTSVGFGSDGAGGMSLGNPTKVENVPVRNPDVLGALTAITGESFGYEKEAWLNWYHQTYFASAGDLRRDQ